MFSLVMSMVLSCSERTAPWAHISPVPGTVKYPRFYGLIHSMFMLPPENIWRCQRKGKRIQLGSIKQFQYSGKELLQLRTPAIG